MQRVVVSVVSILWMIFSTSSLACILLSLFTSGWLRRTEGEASAALFWENNCQTVMLQRSFTGIEDPSQLPAYEPPSLGPLLRCETVCPGHTPAWSIRWLGSSVGSNARVFCSLSFWGGGQKPASCNSAAWTGSLLLLLGTGILLLAQTLICASPCKRELCGRSVFQITGLLQCVADLLLLVGVFTWPAGWASIPVQEVCGTSAAAYQKGTCEWTQSPVFNFVGICLLFISALLATFADRSIMQPSVTRQMLIANKPFIFV